MSCMFPHRFCQHVCSDVHEEVCPVDEHYLLTALLKLFVSSLERSVLDLICQNVNALVVPVQQLSPFSVLVFDMISTRFVL